VEIRNQFLQQVAPIIVHKYVLITFKRLIHYSNKFKTNKIPTTAKQRTLINTFLRKAINLIFTTIVKCLYSLFCFPDKFSFKLLKFTIVNSFCNLKQFSKKQHLHIPPKKEKNVLLSLGFAFPVFVLLLLVVVF